MAVITAILAGCVGSLTTGSHTGEGLMQEGVEVSAEFAELVDFAHRSVAALRTGLRVRVSNH